MITILEGPDGAGKTTLAKSLPDTEYIHFGPPPAGKLGAWRQYLALLEQLWNRPRDVNIIIDRFIYGELIYPKVLGRQTDLTWAHIRMLERVLMGLDADLTICLPPWDTVLRNWGLSKDELIGRSDDLYETYMFYVQLLGRDSMMPVRAYDYTKPHGQEISIPSGIPFSPDTLAVYRYTNEGPGIGLFCPGNILLVGEQINAKTGKEGWPFVSPNASSLWLSQLLEDAKIPEHKLYWVNAASCGVPTDPRFIDKLQPDKVIAMGGKAETWCRLNKIGHESINHPQWHKRFRHHEVYPLIGMLR